MNITTTTAMAIANNWTINRVHSDGEWVSLSRGQVNVYVWFTSNGHIKGAQRWDHGVLGDVFGPGQTSSAINLHSSDKGKAATVNRWLATTPEWDAAETELINAANGRGPALEAIAEVGDDDFQTWKADAADQITTMAGAPIDPEVLRVLVETVSYWHGKLDTLEDSAQRYLTASAKDLHTYLTR